MIKNYQKVFPELPIAKLVFDDNLSNNSDIIADIEENFQGKKWSTITLDDWINTADVKTIAHIITPHSFFYIVPSIILGSLKDANYIDWGIRSILPFNNLFEARGKWWNEYFSLFSLEQKKAIVAFLDKSASMIFPNSEDEYLLTQARKLWVANPGHI